MSRIASSGAVLAIGAVIGLGVTQQAVAVAGTTNFGQQVYTCAHMMLPYDLSADGSISMTMPGATTPMYFRTFGAMVTYMQSQPMCS